MNERIEITVDQDLATLGDAATAEDMERYLGIVREEVQAAFPDADVTVRKGLGRRVPEGCGVAMARALERFLAEGSDDDETTWLADDGTCEIEITADTAREAAQEYVDGGEWGDGTRTTWVNVRAWPANGDRADAESFKIAIEPREPKCDGSHEHDWQNPLSLVGGLEENPGVHGHGGGVIIREVCAHCGRRRTTDTWAQDHETGEQGLESVEYEDADEASLEWVKERTISALVEATAELVGDEFQEEEIRQAVEDELLRWDDADGVTPERVAERLRDAE